MLMLQCSLINWRQIQITMLLYSHRLELISKAFRYEELDGFSSPLRTGPEIYQNGSRNGNNIKVKKFLLQKCSGLHTGMSAYFISKSKTLSFVK